MAVYILYIYNIYIIYNLNLTIKERREKKEKKCVNNCIFFIKKIYICISMLVGEIRFILYWRAFFVVVDVCFVFFV